MFKDWVEDTIDSLSVMVGMDVEFTKIHRIVKDPFECTEVIDVIKKHIRPLKDVF